MNSRVRTAALFILIAAMVIRSQGTGLLEKLRALRASSATTISEVRVRATLDHSCTSGNPPRPAGIIVPVAQTIPFNFPDRTHFLGWYAQHLERCVLTLINSDHQGE